MDVAFIITMQSFSPKALGQSSSRCPMEGERRQEGRHLPGEGQGPQEKRAETTVQGLSTLLVVGPCDSLLGEARARWPQGPTEAPSPQHVDGHLRLSFSCFNMLGPKAFCPQGTVH